MGPDDEAFRRRVAETTTSDAADESSDEEEQTYVVREGAARAIDAEEVDLRQDAAQADSTATRFDAGVSASNLDPRLERPPDLPEMTDVSNVAPDGSSIDQGLTDPLGGDLGGNSIAGGVRGRAAALGGDALGRGVGDLLDPISDAQGPDSDIGGFGPDARRGGTDSHFANENERRGARGEPEMTREEYDQTFGGAGTVPLGEIDWEKAREVDALDREEFYDQFVREEEAAQGVVAGTTSTDEIVDPGYAQPDPTGGDDVIISEAEAAALAARAAWGGGDPTIIRPTDEASVTGYATNLDNNPDNITNYGPEGPQNVQMGENWAPPTDLLFDPPPEGGSASMAGAAAMADPASALGGSSLIGSSTPDEAPPPDPPPGDDPDQGPLGPPGGDGGDS